jgi:phosphatidate cytidylyltransferase
VSTDLTSPDVPQPTATKTGSSVKRLLVAAVLIPPLYGIIRYGSPTAFFFLVLVASTLTLLELYQLHFRTELLPTSEITIGVIGLSLILSAFQWPNIPRLETLLLVITLTLLTYRVVRPATMVDALPTIAILVFGLVYVGSTMGHLLWLRGLPSGELLVIYLLIVTWISDTGAYYAGRTLGRHSLAPTISPKKTVEGLIGGLLAAIAAGSLCAAWFLPSFSLLDGLATGLLIALVGVIGDLAESVLKRSAGVKDSGSLLPGHGGMLDRLDSLLFSGPVFYYYVLLVKGGG